MSNCQHMRQKITAIVYSNGVRHLMYQCQECGAKVGTCRPQSEFANPDAIPAFDVALQEAGIAARRQAAEREWGQKRSRLQMDGESKSLEWWDKYNAYLQSDAWRNKRRMVLQRDGHLCQGCLQTTATQVHHMTYERVGNEFLFDLVSLCDECHRRFHGKDVSGNGG